MKRHGILILVAYIVLCCFCIIGCVSAERKVRIFDVNSGGVMEIRNAASDYTREIAESSPCQSGSAFATLQNRMGCDGVYDRSIIRVYDTNAFLRCTSFISSPDGIYLSPRSFSVCSGKVIFWNSKFDAKNERWKSPSELCIATLVDGGGAAEVQRFQMPTGSGETIAWDQSFMWSSPTSIVANVECWNDKKCMKKIVVVDVSSGSCRFLPFDIRSMEILLSSFEGSLSRRFFSFIKPNGEVAVCDGQGNVCRVINIDQLRTLGLYETLSAENLTICWDDDDVLWVFNPNGIYVGVDVETNSVIRNGRASLNREEELVGLIQKRYAVVKQRRGSEIICNILGARYFIKDLETGSCVTKMPNCISGYAYLGNGLMLLTDL